MLSSILLWLEYINLACDIAFNAFLSLSHFFLHEGKRATVCCGHAGCRRKTVWVHTLSCHPCWLASSSLILTHGFLNNTSMPPLQPVSAGSGQVQFKPGRTEPIWHKYPACGHRKGFKSKMLPPRRRASRVVSASVGEETPQNTRGRDLRTGAELELGWKFCPRNKRCRVDSVSRLPPLKCTYKRKIMKRTWNLTFF